MTAATPKVAFLARGGSLYIGLESGDVELPGLRYPAQVQVLMMPGQNPLAPNRLQVNAMVVPVLLPAPWLALHAGEQLLPLGADDSTYPPAADFVPKYLDMVDAVTRATNRMGVFRGAS